MLNNRVTLGPKRLSAREREEGRGKKREEALMIRESEATGQLILNQPQTTYYYYYHHHSLNYYYSTTDTFSQPATFYYYFHLLSAHMKIFKYIPLKIWYKNNVITQIESKIDVKSYY